MARGAKTRGLAGEIGAGILSLGRDILRYLLVFAVAVGGSRALLWAWRRSSFGLSDIVEGPASTSSFPCFPLPLSRCMVCSPRTGSVSFQGLSDWCASRRCSPRKEVDQ